MTMWMNLPNNTDNTDKNSNMQQFLLDNLLNKKPNEEGLTKAFKDTCTCGITIQRARDQLL